MSEKLLVFKIKKVFLIKPPFLREHYDTIEFIELPLESVLRLSEQSEIDFLKSMTRILEHVASKIYVRRVHFDLSDEDKLLLSSKSMFPLSNYEYAEKWYKLYFLGALKKTPRLVANEKFASEFETVITRLLNILKRRRLLYDANSRMFLNKAKKEQIERIRENLDFDFNFLMGQYRGVGLYGLLVYAYTLYLQKNYDARKFMKVLGL